jgi:glycosyltransferase involved in cell wall biosynthesis
LVVGDGTQRGRLEQLSTWLGIGDRSHFPGFISAEDGLPALYQMSTVFTTASEIETQGLVLLEAAACALPIVAVQATCLHEIVNQGENGFLVRSGDITEMAECIISLVGNPTLAHEMGQMSRRIVESHSMDKTFTAYEDLYLTALKKTGFVFSPIATAPGHAERSGESD